MKMRKSENTFLRTWTTYVQEMQRLFELESMNNDEA